MKLRHKQTDKIHEVTPEQWTEIIAYHEAEEKTALDTYEIITDPTPPPMPKEVKEALKPKEEKELPAPEKE